MIKVTHATGGFSDEIKAVLIDGNKITSVNKKGRESECTWDAEWLIRQAASKDTDLHFELMPE